MGLTNLTIYTNFVFKINKIWRMLTIALGALDKEIKIEIL